MKELIGTLILVLLIVFSFGKYFVNVFLWAFVPQKIKISGKIVALKEKVFEYYTPQDREPNLSFIGTGYGDSSNNLDPIASAFILDKFFPQLFETPLPVKESDLSSGISNQTSLLKIRISEYYIRVMYLGKKYTINVTASLFSKIKKRKEEGIFDISLIIEKSCMDCFYDVVSE
jgi:hypothetical protein